MDTLVAPIHETVSFALTAVFLVVGAEVRGPYAASVILAGGAGALYLSQSSFWAVSADIAGPRSGVISGVLCGVSTGVLPGTCVPGTRVPGPPTPPVPCFVMFLFSRDLLPF